MDNEGFESSMNALEAGAKMGTELIKTTRDFAGFCAKLKGLTDDSIIGLINDKIQFFRYNRQLRIAEEYNKKYGNQPMKPIPPKFLIPILENGSLEEDDYLQDLWINLLGSFTSREYKEEKRIAYMEIIKSLSSLDAKILKEIYLYDFSNKRDDMKFKDITRDQILEKVNDDDFYLSLDNLYRVGCVKNSQTYEGITGDSFSISYLGKKFVEACIH